MAQSTHIAIPKRHRSALVRLVILPPPQLDAFVAAIKRSRPESSIYALAKQLSEELTEIDFDDIYSILSMLASLYRYREEAGASVKQLLDGFIQRQKEKRNARVSHRFLFGLNYARVCEKSLVRLDHWE